MDPKDRLGQWIDLYYGRLFAIAYTYVRDRNVAEDRVQTAYLKAFASMGSLRYGDSPFPWLVKIVINECLSYRKQAGREYSPEYLPELTADSSEDVFFARDREKAVHDAVLSLPVKYRTPIVLFYFHDMSHGEIANILRISTQAVKTRLHRGRQRLMRLLKEDDSDEPGCTVEAGKTVSQND